MSSAVKIIDPLAAAGTKRRERKTRYIEKLKLCLADYKNILIVQCDNVGSNQMQKTRLALRGEAELLLGKNTVIKKIVRELKVEEEKLAVLEPYIYGNIGFVFTNGELKKIRDIVLGNKVPAAAKVGTIAPIDVFIPPGATGLDPGQTAFFQSLNIATKIVKGAIEIQSTVHLIKKGEKVTASHVALLTKLNIQPFFYGFGVSDVYEDGTMYSAEILDMSQEDLKQKFLRATNKLAALSLAIGYPTQASVPHIVRNAFKKIAAISVEADIDIPQTKEIREFLKDPSKFAAAAPAAATTTAAAAAPKEEPKKKEESEESGGDMGFSLFD